MELFELKCKYCDKLLAKVHVFEGDIKCKGCYKRNRFRVITQGAFYQKYLTKDDNYDN